MLLLGWMNVMYIDAHWRSYSLYSLFVVSEFGLLFLPFSPYLSFCCCCCDCYCCFYYCLFFLIITLVISIIFLIVSSIMFINNTLFLLLSFINVINCTTEVSLIVIISYYHYYHHFCYHLIAINIVAIIHNCHEIHYSIVFYCHDFIIIIL